MAGEVGPGQILPDELLSVAGLDLDLTPEQRAVLSREEVASITSEGIRFESILAAGFSLQIVRKRDLTDPDVTYILHELGEETRHSRLFIRLLQQLKPTARNPAEPVFRVPLLYRWVRHPSYTGLLLIAAGIGLANGTWPGLAICLTLPAIALIHRIHVEEAALSRIIGDPYRAYQDHTKRLLPGLW